MPDQPGALVISLDFELHWGVRDHVTRDDSLYGRLPSAAHGRQGHARPLRGSGHSCHVGDRRISLCLDP